MDDLTLRGDCGRCAALCCISFAFDHSDMFGYTKDAGVACRHLTPAHECHIHADLTDFAGCASYDCLGAGQRVTAEVFAGRSWRTTPSLTIPMLDAFRAMREIHELWLLLRTASRLSLTPAQSRERDQLESALAPARPWSQERLAAFENSAISAEIRAFLRSLQACVSRERPTGRRLPVVR